MLVYTDRNTRIRFYSDDILILCRFMEIEKVEFDSTVMKLYSQADLQR